MCVCFNASGMDANLILKNLHLKFANKTWNDTFNLVRTCTVRQQLIPSLLLFLASSVQCKLIMLLASEVASLCSFQAGAGGDEQGVSSPLLEHTSLCCGISVASLQVMFRLFGGGCTIWQEARVASDMCSSYPARICLHSLDGCRLSCRCESLPFMMVSKCPSAASVPLD